MLYIFDNQKKIFIVFPYNIDGCILSNVFCMKWILPGNKKEFKNETQN